MARLQRARDLISVIEGGPEFAVPTPCTLYVASGRTGAWRRVNDIADILPAGTRVRAMGFFGRQTRVKTRDGEEGDISTEHVRGLIALKDMPRIAMVPPTVYADVTGDGIPDMIDGGSFDCLDGSSLEVYKAQGSGIMGIYGSRLVASSWEPTDSLWFRIVPDLSRRGKGVRLAAAANRACDPENSFVYAKRRQVRDSTIRLYGLDASGVAWTKSIPSRQGLFYIWQAGPVVYIGRPCDVHLVSARDGSLIWQDNSAEPDWDAGVVFFCRDGFAVRKSVWAKPKPREHYFPPGYKSGGSSPGQKGPNQEQHLVFRDWQGRLVFDIVIPCRWYFPSPPNDVSVPVYGHGTQMRETHENFASRVPLADTRYLPVVTDDSVMLVSTTDGSRFRSFPTTRYKANVHYDRHGFYIGEEDGFHGYNWFGAGMGLPDMPGALYPLWDGNQAAFLVTGLNMANLVNIEAAKQVARSTH
jgi:hypothetical protein